MAATELLYACTIQKDSVNIYRKCITCPTVGRLFCSELSLLNIKKNTIKYYENKPVKIFKTIAHKQKSNLMLY
jgi:hypothetical protein